MRDMKRAAYIFILLAFMFPAVLFGDSMYSTEPKAYLVYFDDEFEIEVYRPDGTQYDFVDWDMELEEGTTVNTGLTSAEIELEPNGTIIKLSYNTQFTIESLQRDQGTANNFAMAAGKLRAIAARSGLGENYSIRTPSAVCGVRGTDFGLQAIPGSSDAAAVLRGAIEFINTQTGESLQLAAGQAADVFADVFQPINLPVEQITSLFEEMNFIQADPAQVPGNVPSDAEVAEALEEEAAEIVEELTGNETSPPPVETVETDTTADDTEEGPDPGQSNFLEPVFGFLGNFLGMEMGTITLEGKTYAKAVFLPKLELGKFRMALYLPIIYNTNMFDPQDWYMPEGNNEWSFGTDMEGTGPILLDILHDVALKIKYIEYGDNRDTFFFKLGNSESVTLGHGLLLYDYPFDQGFPVVRNLGFNLGLNLKGFGFETLVNDLGDPELLGGRFAIKPLPKAFPFAIGLSSVVDINPASAVINDTETYGNPLFLTAGLDLDVPIIDSDPVSVIIFTDAGAFVPAYREAYGSVASPGIQFTAISPAVDSGFSVNNLTNFGLSGGVLGNIFFIGYRVDVRYSKGVFNPMFFGTDYNTRRAQYVTSLSSYFDDPLADEYQTPVFGVYGELSAAIGKIVELRGGYFWPWDITENGLDTSEDDHFVLQVVLKPDVIPVVAVHGSLSFDRTKFFPTLAGTSDETLSLFDAYTTVKAELAIPIGPVFELAAIYTTATAYDSEGNIIPNPDNPNIPQVNPSVSIETRINF